jgi:hypothetical protein
MQGALARARRACDLVRLTATLRQVIGDKVLTMSTLGLRLTGAATSQAPAWTEEEE